MKKIVFDLSQPAGEEKVVCYSGYTLRMYHKDGDAQDVSRICISGNGMELVLLPSKGLSIYEAFYNGRPIFWEPPLKSLISPDEFDPYGIVYFSGKPARGYRWLELFCGGVEMLGLDNWGMPYEDLKTGKILTLHGTTSVIPVKSVNVNLCEDGVEVYSSFQVCNGEGPDDTPWYKRGEVIFEITKIIKISSDSSKIVIEDSITNKSNNTQNADWGYHIQLRPVEGAEYMVPSKYMREFEGVEIISNKEIWKSSTEPGVRKEVKNVHKNLKISKGSPEGNNGIKTLLKYPDGYGIMTSIPPVPWMCSWYSSGGKGGNEWSFESDKDGRSVIIMDNYDGVGPEFGQSDLGRSGNEEVQYKNSQLDPGQTIDIIILIELLDPEKAKELEHEIREYINDRDLK